MRRKDREMDENFARMVLDKCEYAVLGTVNPDGTPYCIPVTIVRDGDAVYIHSAPDGQKVQNLRQNPHVCLTCVGDTHIPPDKFTTEFESAVAFGTVREVTENEEKIQVLRMLCERHVPTNMAEFNEAVSSSLPRTGVWKLQIEKLTGKRTKFDAQGKEMKFGRME